MPAVERRARREIFEAYRERILASSLAPRRMVVMDNLSDHKGGRVRTPIEERGCKLVYRPLYSLDLNSIGEAFASVKALLRNIGTGSRKALGRALGTSTVRESRGFVGHRSYHAAAQLLRQPL